MKTTSRFTRSGKQVLQNGEHFADAVDDAAAERIIIALNARPRLGIRHGKRFEFRG